ncbi:MAG TPA: glycosyltransferase family 2 protein [candidate division Zixibacteria bacterium]
MSGEKKVSAIVVNWNGIKFLPTCLNSIFKQTYKNLEVIVVDCASKDDSVSFIKSNYPLTKVIELKQDFGPPHAINLAAREVQGEYVLILNNDVYLPENLVTEMASELEKDENCVINPAEFDWEGKYFKSGCTEPWISPFLSKFFKVKGESTFYPSTACCLVSKRVLLENPLNEKLFLYEDTEWGWRLQLKKIKIVVLPNVYFIHKNQGTVSRSKKLAYILGIVPIATQFICFKLSTFIVLFPLTFLLNYVSIWRTLIFLKNYPIGLFYFYKGLLEFFVNFNQYHSKRKKVQSERKITDWTILKIMVGSIYYQKQAQQQWVERTE